MGPGEHGDALRITASSVESLPLRSIGTIPGVAVLASAARNGTGLGTIASSVSGMDGDQIALSWTDPGGGPGAPVLIPSDGDYLLEDGTDLEKWLRVRVYLEYIKAGSAGTVRLSSVYNNAVASDDVSAAEAAAGDVETWTVGVTNGSTVGLSHVVGWIDSDTDGIHISANGSTWVNPTSEGTGLAIGNLAAGATYTLHMKRTITASATADAAAVNLLHFSWEGI
jgi:hypothetical protein